MRLNCIDVERMSYDAYQRAEIRDDRLPRWARLFMFPEDITVPGVEPQFFVMRYPPGNKSFVFWYEVRPDGLYHDWGLGPGYDLFEACKKVIADLADDGL